MARPEGFEPPTPTFVALYSIQLSYGRACTKLYHPSSGSFSLQSLTRNGGFAKRKAHFPLGHSTIYDSRPAGGGS
jgi:hypothetical protein